MEVMGLGIPGMIVLRRREGLSAVWNVVVKNTARN